MAEIQENSSTENMADNQSPPTTRDDIGLVRPEVSTLPEVYRGVIINAPNTGRTAMAEIQENSSTENMADNQSPPTTRDDIGLVRPEVSTLTEVYRGVIINAPNTGRTPVAVQLTSKPCRRVAVCGIVIVLFGIIGVVAIFVDRARESSDSDSYSSYTHDWTTNSDNSLPDKVDITHDIHRPKTKKPSTPKSNPNFVIWHGKRINKTGVTYQNWTQATTDCMDNMETPCSDIYRYTCGGWNAKTRIPDYFNHVDRFQDVTRNITKIVKDYMLKSSKKTTEEMKAIRFYNHCNQFGRWDRQSILTNLHDLLLRLSKGTLTAYSRSTDFEPLLANINKLKSWPIFQLLPRATTDNKTVIAISVGDLSINVERIGEYFVPNFKLSDKVMERIKSKISVLRRAYGNQDKYLSSSTALSILNKHTAFNKLIFNKIWKVPLKSSNLFETYQKTATDLVEDILSLEIDLLLARIPGNVTKDSEKAKEFSVGKLQKKCDIFFWDKYFKEITSKTVSKVVLLQPDIILKICNVVKNYTGTSVFSSLPESSLSSDRKKFQNYVLIRLVKDLLAYYGSSVLLDDDAYSTELAMTEKATRSAKCFAWTSNAFGMVIGSMYLKETNFGIDKHRSKVASILRHVREHYRGLLLQSSWLDGETRTKAISKIDNLYVKLLYPPMIKDSFKLQSFYQKFKMQSLNWYETVIEWMKFEFRKMDDALSLPMDRTVWPIAPHEVNAIHCPWLNDVTIPAGILQPPFFDDSRPMAMNFGALGSIIGHEITHSFGEGGRYYNQYGQMEDWVTWKSQLHLQKTSKCFLDLYKSINYKFEKLIGNRTLEEDMSDNGGIIASYGAYQTWKKKNVEHLSNETQLWMKAEKLTLDELFIIAYSQMYCATWTEDWLKTLSSRKHSPGLLRVKGTFENNDFMRLDFACPPSYLQQCNLW